MNEILLRVLQKKTECKLTWDKLCKKSKIGLSTWMVGADEIPTDKDLKKIAKTLGTSLRWLKYGKTEDN